MQCRDETSTLGVSADLHRDGHDNGNGQATWPNRQRLGDLLIEQGVLSREEFDAFVKR